MPKVATITRRMPQGFTLVEIMVVIVILTIFASVMTLSIGGSESRKNLAFYEHLQGTLTYVRLLSAEQMQPYGIAIKLPQDNRPKQLMVVKLVDAFNQSDATKPTISPSWQLVYDIEPLELPPNLDLTITPTDQATPMQPIPAWLVGDQAPPVVWFGNGEATSVQIALFTTHPNDPTRYPVAEPIVINNAGAIEAPSGQRLAIGNSGGMYAP